MRQGLAGHIHTGRGREGMLRQATIDAAKAPSPDFQGSDVQA